MKRTTSPKTKTFVLSPRSYSLILAAFNLFHYKPHSHVFKDCFMSSPDYLAAVSLANFSAPKPVKSIEIIYHYE